MKIGLYFQASKPNGDEYRSEPCGFDLACEFFRLGRDRGLCSDSPHIFLSYYRPAFYKGR